MADERSVSRCLIVHGHGASSDQGRTLIDDLYADAQIYQVLALYGVVIPDEWSATGPFESLARYPCPQSW